MKFASLAKVCWLMLLKSETESPYVLPLAGPA